MLVKLYNVINEKFGFERFLSNEWNYTLDEKKRFIHIEFITETSKKIIIVEGYVTIAGGEKLDHVLTGDISRLTLKIHDDRITSITYE